MRGKKLALGLAAAIMAVEFAGISLAEKQTEPAWEVIEESVWEEELQEWTEEESEEPEEKQKEESLILSKDDKPLIEDTKGMEETGLTQVVSFIEDESDVPTSIEPQTEVFEKVSETATDSIMDTLPESSTEVRTQSDDEGSGQTEAQSESEEEQTGAQSESEEEQTEPQSESKEGQTEHRTERQDETQPDTQVVTDEVSEAAQEQTARSGHWIVRVSNIRLAGEASRKYDGTDEAKITYDVDSLYAYDDGQSGGASMQREPGESFPENPVLCSCHLSSANAGRRQVQYAFVLSGLLPENTELIVEQTVLYVTIMPAKLKIHLPDGWKYYHDEAVQSSIHLTGQVTVTGFVTGSDGEYIIPPKLRLPEAVLSGKLGADTPQYVQGQINTVQGAITVKKNADGSITGSTGSGNYVFDETLITGGNVTIRQAKVAEGRDYTVTYPADRSYAKNGTVYLAQGEKPDVTVHSGSGYNRIVWISEHSAALQKKSGDQLLAQSAVFEVSWNTDAEPPGFALSASGGSTAGDALYKQDKVTIVLQAPSDIGSGIVEAGYEVTRDGREISSGSFLGGAVISLEEEGTYAVYAYAADRVGNRTQKSLSRITVDRTAPQITVSGIADEEDRSEPSDIRVNIADKHLDISSVEAQLIGSGTAEGVVISGTVYPSDDGAQIVFPLSQSSAQADGRYTLHVSGQDYAANRAYDTLSFTLNRSGPVFGLDSSTAGQLGSYWHKVPFALVMTAVDQSSVTDLQMVCLHGRETFILSEGSGISVLRKTMPDGRTLVTCTVSADTFAADGQYEVILVSADEAGHNRNSAGVLSVRFGIDSQAPDCVVSTSWSGSVTDSDRAVLVMQPRDNLALGGLSLYVDGRKVMEKTGDEIAGEGGTVRYGFADAQDWQVFRICVWDQAGNESWTKPASVFVRKDDTVSIPRIRNRYAQSTVEQVQELEQETEFPGEEDAGQQEQRYGTEIMPTSGTEAGTTEEEPGDAGKTAGRREEKYSSVLEAGQAQSTMSSHAQAEALAAGELMTESFHRSDISEGDETQRKEPENNRFFLCLTVIAAVLMVLSLVMKKYRK